MTRVLIIASTEANADTSFANMSKLQARALHIVLADPAVANVGSSIGAGGPNPTLNQGRMYVSLKPLGERDNVPTADVIDRLRKPLGTIVGLATRLVPSRDIRAGARRGQGRVSVYPLVIGRRTLRLGSQSSRGRPQPFLVSST